MHCSVKAFQYAESCIKLKKSHHLNLEHRERSCISLAKVQPGSSLLLLGWPFRQLAFYERTDLILKKFLRTDSTFEAMLNQFHDQKGSILTC